MQTQESPTTPSTAPSHGPDRLVDLQARLGELMHKAQHQIRETGLRVSERLYNFFDDLGIEDAGDQEIDLAAAEEAVRAAAEADSPDAEAADDEATVDLDKH